MAGSAQFIKQELLRSQNEILIELVRANSCLFNSRDPSYRDTKIKDNAWQEIAKSLGLPQDECQRRWKILRDSFNRIATKKCQPIANGTVTPDWPYFKQMLWYKDFVGLRRRAVFSFEAITPHHNGETPLDSLAEQSASTSQGGNSSLGVKPEHNVSHTEPDVEISCLEESDLPDFFLGEKSSDKDEQGGVDDNEVTSCSKTSTPEVNGSKKRVKSPANSYNKKRRINNPFIQTPNENNNLTLEEKKCEKMGQLLAVELMTLPDEKRIPCFVAMIEAVSTFRDTY